MLRSARRSNETHVSAWWLRLLDPNTVSYTLLLSSHSRIGVHKAEAPSLQLMAAKISHFLQIPDSAEASP